MRSCAPGKWEAFISALFLILALVAPLTAAVCIIYHIPVDFSPAGRGVPLVIIGMSSLSLFFYGGSYFMPVSAMPLMIYGAACALPFAASLLLWRTAPQNGNSLADIGVLLLLAGMYGCGLVDVLNGAFTRAPPTRVLATVTAMRSESFKAGHNYFVRLSSTDPKVATGEWRISRDDHWHLNTGSQTCVDLYTGALGADWYRAGMCPGKSEDTITWVGTSGPLGEML